MFIFNNLKQGLIALTTCALLTSPAIAKDLNETINVNGKTRSYLVHIPDRLAATQKVPLVMMLHGGGGGPESIIRSSEMSAKADKEGFIAVYPAGIDTATGPLKGTWNAVGCCGAAMRNKEDDILFISKLIDKMIATRNIDAKRVYVGGMSNGALMSERLAAVIGNKISAIASVSGGIFSSQPAARVPVPTIIFHGLKDDMVPYAGGMSPNKLVATNQALPFKPTPESFNYWRTQNRCTGPLAVQKGVDFTLQTASRCAGGADVVFYTMMNGGHEWPRKDSTWGPIRGNSTPSSINATDVMWTFFKAHPRQ